MGPTAATYAAQHGRNEGQAHGRRRWSNLSGGCRVTYQSMGSITNGAFNCNEAFPSWSGREGKCWSLTGILDKEYNDDIFHYQFYVANHVIWTFYHRFTHFQEKKLPRHYHIICDNGFASSRGTNPSHSRYGANGHRHRWCGPWRSWHLASRPSFLVLKRSHWKQLRQVNTNKSHIIYLIVSDIL